MPPSPVHTAPPSRTRVTVIIATRTRARFLDEALTSVLTQTVVPDQILLVDDHSDAPAWQEVQRLSQRSPRIELHRLPLHRGVAAARNHGLALARGECVLFLDDDDWLQPRAIERSLAVLDQRADVDAVVCGFRVMRMPDAAHAFRASNYRLPARAPLGFSAILRNCFAIHACLIRTASIGDHRFPEDLWYAEDQYFWLGLAQRGCRFAARPERDAVIRRHGSNATNRRGQVVRDALQTCYSRLLADDATLDEADRVLMQLKLAYWGVLSGRAGWSSHARDACGYPGRVLRECAHRLGRRVMPHS